MKLTAAIMTAAVALCAAPVGAQQPAFVDAAEIDALWQAIGARCKTDEPRLAQCIIVLTMTDCTQAKGRRLPYLTSKIVKVNEDKTVNLQGVAAPVAVAGLMGTTYNADGVSIPYGAPQIITWQEFKKGRRVNACEKQAKLEASDFKLPKN